MDEQKAILLFSLFSIYIPNKSLTDMSAKRRIHGERERAIMRTVGSGKSRKNAARRGRQE